MNEPSPKRIGIAVVEHAGRFLVGTRGPEGPLAGYAEFPGGKCLPQESAWDCARRECFEEAQVDVVEDRLLLRCEFQYPHAVVDLSFFLCHPADESLIREDHQGFHWVPASDLAKLRFPEANFKVIEILAGSF